MSKYKFNIKLPPLRDIYKLSTLKHYFKKFIGLKATPHKLAFSVAIGVFIGFLVPIGFQTFFIIPLALALEVNLIVAYISTLVSNPVTAIPMYYVAVSVGNYITGLEVSWKNIESVFTDPSLSGFISVGSDSMVVFFTGSFVLGMLASILLYLFTLKIVVYYRKLHENLTN